MELTKPPERPEMKHAPDWIDGRFGEGVEVQWERDLKPLVDKGEIPEHVLRELIAWNVWQAANEQWCRQQPIDWDELKGYVRFFGGPWVIGYTWLTRAFDARGGVAVSVIDVYRKAIKECDEVTVRKFAQSVYKWARLKFELETEIGDYCLELEEMIDASESSKEGSEVSASGAEREDSKE